MAYKDISGQRFGKLIALRATDKRCQKRVAWECLCDCGNNVIVDGAKLRNGHTKSCGCYRRELTTTHGMTNSNNRLYSIWRSIRSRCNCSSNTHYHRYGGRGITVCNEWLYDFSKFEEWAIYNGYEGNLTIDRINNDGNYEPSNCKWVTRKEQANNRSTNRIIEFNGEVKNLKQWAEALRMPIKTLEYRLDSWALEDALTKPVDKKYSHGRRK